MRVLVTGASGFVGRHVVAAALAAGHQVRAMIRPATSSFFGDAVSGLEVLRADLRAPSLDPSLVEGVDAVIHLAAAKSGSYSEQFAGTVVATERLLAVMAPSAVPLVGMSSFSVYDHRNTPPGSVIDESTPTDPTPADRDEYARTKIVQEQLFVDHRRSGAAVCVVRPGMIYGEGNLWHALVGVELGPLMVEVRRGAPLPLTYVANCATAVVAAAQRLTAGAAPEVVCVVDSEDGPSLRQYTAALRRHTTPPRRVPLPWPVVRAGAAALAAIDRRVFDDTLKLPGFLVEARLEARFKPFRYSNRVAREALGWQPSIGLDDAVRMSATGLAPFDRSGVPEWQGDQGG